MYSPLQLGWKYLHYLLTAKNGKGHGMHSPFVYAFITEVLNDRQEYYCYAAIEALRLQLLHDDKELTIDDYGAGSRTGAQKQRTVAAIAKSALKPRKFGQLLFRIVNYYQPSIILELGTSLGITSAYLASAHTTSTVYTLEGAPQVAGLAGEHFQKLGLKNIQQVTGNFDDTLEPLLKQLPAIDFVYIDGNHRYEPTIRYFRQMLPLVNENTVLIFDDIHWSAGMEKAWAEVMAHDAVKLTIDLFFIGLVFFRQDFKVKQNFTIRF